MATNNLEFVITAKDEASDKLKSIGEIGQKIGAAMTIAGGAIVAFGTVAVKAAAEAEVQMAQAHTTIERAVDALNDVSYAKLQKEAGAGADVLDYLNQKLEDGSKAALKLGFDDESAAQSLAILYQRTGDMTEAQKLQITVMDLARAKNIDLATATTLVGQVLSGNGRVLKQYGINIKDAATPLEALTELQTKVGGQADAFSKTFTGQSEVLQETLKNLEETIGEKLIPILQKLLQDYILPVVQKMQAWTDAHPQLTEKIVMVVAAVGALMLVLGPLLVALPALITFFGALAGPVGIIIGIIVGLGVAVMNIVKIFELFRDHSHEIWEGIKAYFQEAIQAIIGYFQPLIDIFNAVINKISAVGSAVSNYVGGAASGVVANAISGRRASGGSVFAGGSYLVGENGPEVFSPSFSGSISPNSGGGSSAININISGAIFTQDAARMMGDMIVQNLKRVSKLGL